jgi:hypothetical protein
MEAAWRKETPEMDWLTQGLRRAMRGLVGERRSGRWDSKLRAKRVPALWETMLMCFMLKWVRRAGIVSRKMGMRCEIGTGVEPPKPGLMSC